MFLPGNDCDRSGVICGAHESCTNTTSGYDCICNTGYKINAKGMQCEGEIKMLLHYLSSLLLFVTVFANCEYLNYNLKHYISCLITVLLLNCIKIHVHWKIGKTGIHIYYHCWKIF